MEVKEIIEESKKEDREMDEIIDKLNYCIDKIYAIYKSEYFLGLPQPVKGDILDALLKVSEPRKICDGI